MTAPVKFRDLDGSHHGLSQREQEIMDLHDAGVRSRFIARELNLQHSYVVQIIQLFDFRSVWGQSDSFEHMVARGSMALARAIERSGGRFA